jgi:hypothetical protein
MNIMRSMALKYSVEWRFTVKEDCGETIARILGAIPDEPEA